MGWSFRPLSLHLFNHLLSTYYILSLMLSAYSTDVNSINMVPTLSEVKVWLGKMLIANLYRVFILW